MKAVICDVCGTMALEADKSVKVETMIFTRGGNPMDIICKKDMCEGCETRLWDLILSPKKEVVADLIPEVKKSVPVVFPSTDPVIADFKAIPEDTKFICPQCHKPFEPVSKRSKFCSKKCVNEDYTARKQKERTDQILAKLKKENPMPKIARGEHNFV